MKTSDLKSLSENLIDTFNLAGKKWNVEPEGNGFGIDLKLNLGMLCRHI